MDKAGLRKQLQTVLLQIPPSQRAAKSKLACKNLIATEQFQRANTIMTYLSLPHETDTSDLVLSAWQLGKTVVAPRISWQQRHMIPVVIKTLDTGFATEIGGLRNPVSGEPMPFNQIDLVIAPGLGFDKKGNRLGRGGSYYDRFFTHKDLKAARCGLAFSEQLLDSVPITERDIPMDLLVTDKQVLYFNTKK
jgi:5-formyltetrahydrofolate cyclo-ligase